MLPFNPLPKMFHVKHSTLNAADHPAGGAESLIACLTTSFKFKKTSPSRRHRSFADAKAGENPVQYLVRSRFSGNFPQGVKGFP